MLSDFEALQGLLWFFQSFLWQSLEQYVTLWQLAHLRNLTSSFPSALEQLAHVGVDEVSVSAILLDVLNGKHWKRGKAFKEGNAKTGAVNEGKPPLH